MTNNEKFEGFAQKLINENENKFGKEIREQYGDEVVNRSNASLKEKTKEQFEDIEVIRVEYEGLLKAAGASGIQGDNMAQRAVELHGEWLSFYNPSFSKEYHIAMREMYTQDERFRSYYENIVTGGAAFLKKAIEEYYKTH